MPDFCLQDERNNGGRHINHVVTGERTVQVRPDAPDKYSKKGIVKMTKNAKRFISVVLALAMVFSLVIPAGATEPHTHADELVGALDGFSVEAALENVKVDANDIELEVEYDAPLILADPNVEVDEDDPAIIAFETELKNIKVWDEAAQESKPLTEEEIQTVLGLYYQYLSFWDANADTLGLQTPFFLSFNDSGEDGLGVLGEMLALAGTPVDAVRAGYMTLDDLTGMILNFFYGDQLGVQFYGAKIEAARDEVMQAVKASGAKTEAQKLLVINDWLAHNNTFDMPYIMNANKEVPPMVAEEPVKHEHYDDVFAVMTEVYTASIRDTFEQQIVSGLEAEFKYQYYAGALKEIMYQGGLAQASQDPELIAAVQAGLYQQMLTLEQQKVYDAAYQQYLTDNNLTDTPDEPNAEAAAAAEAAVEAQAEAIAAAATAATEDQLETAIKQAVTGGTDAVDTDVEKQVEEQVNAFIAANEEALRTDPAGFVDSQKDFTEQMVPVTDAEGNYIIGEDGQPVMMPLNQYLHMGWDAFWEDAQKNGVEVDPVNAPGYKMTVDQIVEQQMNTAMADLPQKPDGNHMTPNEAIPVFAAQAAEGLTGGIINYWEGSHFGALGFGTSVCLGYTRAFTYFVQCLHPEIYGVNGASTDMSEASNWKTREQVYVYNEDGSIDINQNYVVDAVRITFDASVTMYGQTEDNFNNDHFWNAAKVDGKWYYFDPCYTDVFTEVMMRDRVETDGQMNHLYFMFSHNAAVQMYDGNYKEIRTLYDTAATDETYEDSWMARIKSNTYFANDGYAYYIYDSSDMLTMMEDFENESQDSQISDTIYKLVRHQLDTTDGGNGDSDYEELIVFNYMENENADPVARVRQNNTMVENEMLTALFEKHTEYAKIYPSIAITAGYYNGKVYFNLANCILSYDVATGEVVLVKEYNTVHGQRDKSQAFGGMAFSVVSSGGDFTVENRPIAGLTIKGDGNIYVSVATNFAYISGKADRCDPASAGYGYAYEESNYNSDYNTYSDLGNYDDAQLEQMGYVKEVNDNDEFMWTANFVEVLPMSHLAGSGHNYQTVYVEAFCGEDAYTEDRCTTCGAAKAGSRVVEEGTALQHHYIEFNETFYTKDKEGNWNTGVCYVCTICGYAISEPVKPSGWMADQEGAMETYEEELAIYEAAKASAGHTYVPRDLVWAEDNSSVTFSKIGCSSVCPERKPYLDCLLNDDTLEYTVETVTQESTITGASGTCPEGVIVVYDASGEVEVAEGKKIPYSVQKIVDLAPTEHTWGEVEYTFAEDGSACTATRACIVETSYKETAEAVITSEVKTAATCDGKGVTTYTATFDVEWAETQTKEIEDIGALGHDWSEEITYTFADDGKTCTAERVCKNDAAHKETAEAVITSAEKTAATCEDKGVTTYTATFDVDWAETQTKDVEDIDALGHDWSVKYNWSSDGKACRAEHICANDADHNEGAIATSITSAPGKAPTCEDKGTTIYTATFAEDWAETQTKDVEDKDALGHDWSEKVTYNFAEDGKTCTAERVCENDAAHKDTANAVITSEVKTAATCDEEGVTAYTATFTADWAETQTKDVTVDALGHDWADADCDTPKTCKLCALTEGEALGHTYEDFICIVCGDCAVDRISGEGRVETGIEVAEELKAVLGVEKFDAIILANGDNFADALAGSYLATVEKAPILLHRNSGKGDDLNEAYISENLVAGGTVYLLGGTAAIPESVETSIAALGCRVVRLKGATRFDTNLEILKAAGISASDEILITTGWEFADCLSASASGKPILMLNTNKGELTENQIAFLEQHTDNSYTIIGGTAAVSENLETAIEAIVGETDRLSGGTREETSVLVAEKYFEEPECVLIAYSRNFPDGLCGGPLAYAMNAPLLLVNVKQEAAAAAYIEAEGITAGYVLGGKAALSDETVKTVFDLPENAVIAKK